MTGSWQQKQRRRLSITFWRNFLHQSESRMTCQSFQDVTYLTNQYLDWAVIQSLMLRRTEKDSDWPLSLVSLNRICMILRNGKIFFSRMIFDLKKISIRPFINCLAIYLAVWLSVCSAISSHFHFLLKPTNNFYVILL